MRIWIDLTDFLSWKGNLTGIQRIQFNLSKQYKESKHDVRFFFHDALKARFVECDFIPEEVVTLGVMNHANAQRRAYKSQALNRLRHSIGTTRNDIVKAFRVLFSRPPKEVLAPFIEGDMVLVIDGSWDSTFIHDLKKAKLKYRIKIVHFAFDMIPSRFPGYVVGWLPKLFTEYMKVAFEISDGIISISKSTTKDVEGFIKEHCIKSPSVVKTVRIGESVHEDRFTIDKSQGIEGLAPGFILAVSTIEARKNHIALLYMYQEARQRGIQLPKIVIVGRNGWQTNDFRHIVHKDPNAKKGIVILNKVNDAELNWLYTNCLFTIFPSFYEGWGMPIAESLSYGKMCIASNTSSMPEIAGNLIDYFSPYDTGAILQAVVKYLDPKVLKSKENAIKLNYRHKSWADMFTEVNEFIESID